jgi:hypothetical protein
MVDESSIHLRTTLFRVLFVAEDGKITQLDLHDAGEILVLGFMLGNMFSLNFTICLTKSTVRCCTSK